MVFCCTNQKVFFLFPAPVLCKTKVPHHRRSSQAKLLNCEKYALIFLLFLFAVSLTLYHLLYIWQKATVEVWGQYISQTGWRYSRTVRSLSCWFVMNRDHFSCCPVLAVTLLWQECRCLWKYRTRLYCGSDCIHIPRWTFCVNFWEYVLKRIMYLKL